jgi:hypothetical protein
MRARFDSSYIRSELERIGQQLDNPLTVFLIGGGSMAFRGLKTGVDTDGSAKNLVGSLVFECGVDLCVAASIKFPHLKGDLVAFSVTLGCLIPLV